MTLIKLKELYLQFLWDTFQYDIEVFSTPWVWFCFLFPAFVYFIFFCFKWSILLSPFIIILKVFLYTLGVVFGRN